MMVIDLGRERHLARLRNYALLGALLCLVGLICNLVEIEWPADAVLVIGVVVFIVHAINYEADRQEMSLVEHERLRWRKEVDERKTSE